MRSNLVGHLIRLTVLWIKVKGILHILLLLMCVSCVKICQNVFTDSTHCIQLGS